MTNEQAIKRLEGMLVASVDSFNDSIATGFNADSPISPDEDETETFRSFFEKDFEAYRIAITALKAQLFQEGTTKDATSDTISRQAAIDALNHEYRCGDIISQCGIEVAIDIISELPTIQPVATDTNVGDTISRQAAVELVMKYCTDDDGTVQCDGDIRELLDELENLPSAQPEQRWIPCSERLPEIPCLVSDANHNTPYVLTSVITLEDKEHGKWAIDGRWLERTMVGEKKADMLVYHNRIVAWMPLPEPYKEGETK